MSVRRLAEDTLQPEGFKFDRARSAEAKVWIKKYPKGRQQSAVIPLLMLAQDQEGWVTKASIEHIAEMLDMPLIRVMEVATFYTQFMLQPVGTKAHIQVCGTTPCMLRGSEDLMKVCQRKINEQQFHRNAEGTLSWEEVECQGACVNAPMVMIGRDAYEDLTPERLEEIIDAFEAGKGDTIQPGPQIDRVYAAPVTGLTSLLDEAKPAAGKRARGSAKTGGKTAKPAAKSAAKPASTKQSARKASPTAEIAKTASAVRPKRKPPAKTVEGGNPTMKLAATASGRAKPSAKAAKATPTRAAAKGAAVKPASDAAKPALDHKNRPPVVEKPAQPDDLKLISGVGPKLEGTLHSLGIYTFAQVSKWKKAEREWVDGYLKFKGRIDRDDWVRQAKALAKGGVDEYVRVFGKKPR